MSSSLADVLASEVTALVERPCVRMDSVTDTTTIQANRNVLAEAVDQTKPYRHLCETLSSLQEVCLPLLPFQIGLHRLHKFRFFFRHFQKNSGPEKLSFLRKNSSFRENSAHFFPKTQATGTIYLVICLKKTQNFLKKTTPQISEKTQ